MALHHNKARFEQRFGKQDDLLAKAAQIVAEQGYSIPVGFMQWLDGPEREG